MTNQQRQDLAFRYMTISLWIFHVFAGGLVLALLVLIWKAGDVPKESNTLIQMFSTVCTAIGWSLGIMFGGKAVDKLIDLKSSPREETMTMSTTVTTPAKETSNEPPTGI